MSPVAPDVRRVLLSVLAATTAAVLVAGCGTAQTPGTPPPATPGARASRAADLLDRYAVARAKAGSPALSLGDQLEQQDGDWEPAVGANNKIALLTGHLVAVGPLPASPGQGLVLDGSGQARDTAILSAGDALAAMTARRGDCGGCTDLQVTGADRATLEVSTSAGSITVPAWRFHLSGTSVTVRRVAVPASGLVSPQGGWSPAPGDGLRPDSFEPGPGGRSLILTFTGSPDEPGACGADYRAEAYGSDGAVVVAVVQVPRQPSGQEVACPAIGAVRTVAVTLDRPLGERAVLRLADGQPLVRGPRPVDGIPAR